MAWALSTVSGFMFETCCNCGVEFAMTDSFYNNVKGKPDRWFYCPNGHQQHYTTTKSDDQLKEARRRAEIAEAEAAAAKRQRDWAQKQAKGANIAAGKAKAQLRRTVQRVEAGVCPHCKRTFKQLAAHMQSKHTCHK